MTMTSPRFTDGRLHETLLWSRPMPRFPFLQATPPDRHARLNDRKFLVDPLRYVPKLPNRTSYTNHLLQSNNFGTSWTNTGLTITADNAANPWDGATTVDKLLEAAPATEHRVAQAHTFAATANCLWAIVKAGLGRDYARLLANDGTTDFRAFFDLAHGSVFSSANCTAGVRALEDDYQLVWIVFTPLAAAGNVYLNVSTDGSTVSYAGDTAKGLYVAQVQLERASAPSTHIITTTASRTILCPDIDPLDMFAYLELEGDPVKAGGDMWTVERTFARIPRAQLSYPGARTIQKPDYTPTSASNPFTQGAVDEGVAVRWSDYTDLGAASYAASTGLYTATDSKVYAPIKTLGAVTLGYASAGTFTITYKTSTTAALAYNAAGSTILAALNALADVITDGITITSVISALSNSTTSGALDLSMTIGGTTPAAFTLDATGLTVNTSKNPTTSVISTTFQQIRIPSHFTCTGHGLSASLDLAVVYPSAPVTFVLPTGYWGVIDANTLWFPLWGNNTYAASLAGTYASTYTGPAAVTYTAGSRTVRHRIRSTFPLPGVTPGISAVEDIVGPATYQNPDDMLDALLANLTGWQNYENDGPAPWLGSAIHKLNTAEIYFDDLT